MLWKYIELIMRTNHKLPRVLLRSAAKSKLHCRQNSSAQGTENEPYSNSMKEGAGADTNLKSLAGLVSEF